MQKEKLKQQKGKVKNTNNQAGISPFEEDGKRKSKSTILIEIGCKYELFHDEIGEGYVTITGKNHKETWPIRSRKFAELLADKYFALTERGVSKNTISDTMDTLCGKARVHGKSHSIYRRIASANGNIYIDLCNDKWQVVEITANGWKIIENSPVKFLRNASSQSLPTPQKGGTLDDLWNLINVREEDRPLVAGFLIRALCPESPYFGLCVAGEQGTGKSTFCTMIRSFSDPSTAMLRPPPKDDRDFLAGAVNNWCLTYDNLSGIQPWLSDSFCRILTGGSFASRTLYSTTEETTIPLARPVILNGIDDIATRPDLADRVIAIELQPIKDSNRLEERHLWENFNKLKGGIFGVLLDGLSSALKNVDSISLEYRPRQLDATKWASAAEAGLGFASGSFVTAYQRNQKELVSISLESSPFIAALIDMLKEKQRWAGTCSDLLTLLPNYVRDEDAVKSTAWPKSPAWGGRTLKRHAPALRKVGMDIEFSKNESGRFITLYFNTMQDKAETSKLAESTVFTVHAVQDRFEYDSKDGKDSKKQKNSENTITVSV